MMITDTYLALQRQAHETKDSYGVSGQKYAEMVREIVRKEAIRSILDYGCGKRTLEQALGFAISNYDPAIPGCERTPDPHELVVCTDVLEHIEPACLDDVLDDLRRVTERVLFLDVATRPAVKHLADGRNMHLIIEPARWWLPQLMQRFDLRSFASVGGEFVAVMDRRKDLQ
jgi:hypothetical protein